MRDAPFAPRTVMVTGGSGFIGSNLVRWILAHEPTVTVVNLDALTYAGNPESLTDVDERHGPHGDGRYAFVHGDIRDASLVRSLLAGDMQQGDRDLPRPDAILHLAAESHVDRSILGPAEFVATNVQGTLTLLECARRELAECPRSFRFINVSTDEVYGSLTATDPAFTERHPLRPNSPYSASKAGADCLVRAYTETFGLPCITTRCSNNYGPYQFPEKLIPLMITRALGDESLPVYGDGRNVRDWLHVNDHASAIWRVCTHGRVADEVYNIGGNAEWANIDVVRLLLRELGKPESLITYVADRLGHDRRYAMDNARITTQLGWRPAHTFEEGLRETVAWYRENERWWRRVQSEAYRASHALYLTPSGQP
ncbi:MAG: dTDP-glucose 4,6-dehydratase [Gemmatimonadaceae bacterium]